MKKTAVLKKKKTIVYLIMIFVITILITGIVGLSRKVSKPRDEVYVKIKLSQGLWWSMSGNPPIWLAQAIKVGDREQDLFGNEIATVIDRTYYPSEPLKFPNQYEVYVTLKLAVKKDQGTEKYRYKRNALSVGSPINIDLASATVTGSVMELSKSPIKDESVTKKITLFNQYGYYSDSPTEFSAIKIGDEYFDGQNNAFKITKKYLGPRLVAFSDQSGKSVVNQINVNQNIYIEAEIKLKEINGMFFFGEEQRVVPGANLNLLTNSQDLTKYTVVSVE